MTAGSPEVLALGLGNLLLSDDAVGLKLAAKLHEDVLRVHPSARFSSQAIEIVDGGTRGIALLGLLEDRESVLILDAISLGAKPGTVHLLHGDQISELRAKRSKTAHEGNALELLETARLLGILPPEVVIIGIEPKSVHTGIGLSPEVQAAIPDAMISIHDVLDELLEGRALQCV